MKAHQFINWEMRDWAYTLKISAGAPSLKQWKNIDLDEEENYPQNKKILRYRDLDSDHQKEMIKAVIDEIPKSKHVTIFFETHADGRLHAHGTIYECCEMQMLAYRCKINRLLGYKEDNPNMFYYKKVKDSVGWDAYCKKHQKILEDEEGVGDEAGLPDRVYNTNVFKTPDPNSL